MKWKLGSFLKSLYSSVYISTTHFGKIAYDPTIKTNNRNHNKFIKKIARSSVFFLIQNDCTKLRASKRTEQSA